jgi:hypothetical protein
LIASVKSGLTETLPDQQGNHTLPSVVRYTKNEIIVGVDAKSMATEDPLNTISSVKRYMLELQFVSFDDEKDMALDPAFLMEQIKLREALEELNHDSDPISSLNQIMADKNQLDDMQKNKVKQLVHKMQFLNKLQQEAEYQEENLFNTIQS